MRKGSIGILAIMLLAFVSSGTAAGIVSLDANATANSSVPSESAAVPAGPASIQGVWKVSLAGADITMALNQSGDSLFGQCKFEGDTPWNGAVAGSVSGRIVNIAMAALQGKVLVSTDITGAVSDDAITGNYIRFDSDGLATKGDMKAAKISADPTDYSPANIETPEEASAVQTTDEQAQKLGSQVAATQPSSTSGSIKYNDVTNLAKSIDPNILPRHASL